MNQLPRRAFIVAVLMATTSVLAYWAKPSTYYADVAGKPDLETLFPRQFGDWRVDPGMGVVLPAPDVQAKLNSIYNQVLARTYVNGAGQRVMLSVAYGSHQSNDTRVHRPEVCYPAQGFQILSSVRSTIAVDNRQLPVRHLMSKLGSRAEPITYWVVVGERVAVSHMEQRSAELHYSLRGLIADGMLVRVSSIDADPARGHMIQANFARTMAGAMSTAARKRFIGVPPPA